MIRLACLRIHAPIVLSLLVLLAFGLRSASGHELRPGYLELKETAPAEFDVLWKTPARGEMRLSLNPVFTGRISEVTPRMTRMTEEASVQTWKLKAEGLRGQTVSIEGLRGTMTDVLVRIEFTDGEAWVHRLTPSHASADIPMKPTRGAIAAQYARLGVEHILTGFDHLLFVLALIFLTTGGWNLVRTISAFTLSHTVTLSAATFGWVNLPQRPVEAIIALSIVFAAVEILRKKDGREGLATRAPWLMAFGFGLLHGLGFAGGLSEAGLPAGHIPEALLFFSVGVEAGHLMFIAAVLPALALAGRAYRSAPRWLEHVPPYAIGSVASFWLIQRILTF